MSHCRLTVTVERKPDGWNAACACGATSGTHQLLSRALAFPRTGRAGREGEARKARPTKITGWGRGRVNDVDPVVVDRLIHGEPVTGVIAWERREAVKRLRLTGASYSRISRLTGANPRQVHRDLRRAGLVRVTA